MKKSFMSRVALFASGVMLAMCLSLTSCGSSPASDGKKAAELWLDVMNGGSVEKQEEYKDLMDKYKYDAKAKKEFSDAYGEALKEIVERENAKVGKE